jgi:Na+-driven multidrug efflux pump
MMGGGMTIAIASLIGRHLGISAYEDARRTAYAGAVLTTVGLTTLSMATASAAPWIVPHFLIESDSVALTITMIWLLALCMPFVAVELAALGVLRGAGDTRRMFHIALAGLIARIVFVGMIMMTDLSVIWVCAALLADVMIKSAFYVVRVRSDTWPMILASK